MRLILRRGLLALVLILSPMIALAEEAKPRLFVNLTTDDTWAATKAIMFAHQKAQKNGYDAAIWLNVRAVYLADKKRPSHVHGLMVEKGASVQDMLVAFINDGGTVIMCGACSKAAGLTKADYIDGVTMGNFELIESWLFDPNTQTLGW
ncbi:DsrE/DsrF-like family protein [Shimia gijangensis]|uniref:DsrE/DsrF-like family protein n=1 Tax=Shimia gijangensis TaxID=1470563 RepID=A0A1M6EMV5_9RHOB|nr:DsrE family protein [Shimia gijangensis]SHI86822.1 DsrE/DsrF-like family protein [Shimia gijangensis]